jgi:PAS domain S-box-containing protein
MGQKRILLVEDEEVIALLETNWLINEGYEVLRTSSGEEAVKIIICNNLPVDLIIMDIDLGGGMDGIDAAKEIIKIKNTPVVFLSSHTEKELLARAEEVASFGFIIKDNTSTVLLTAIKMALKLYETQNEVRNANNILNAIAESSEDIYLFAVNSEYKYISFNRTYSDIIKKYLKKEIVVGAEIFNILMPGNYADNVKQHLDSALRGKSIVTIDKYTNEDSSLIYWENHWNPISNQEGRITGVICLTLDITGKKIAEMQLEESAEKFKTIINASIDGFWLNDADGRLMDVNPACCSMMGYSRDEMLKMYINQIDINEDLEEVRKHAKMILEKGFDRFETRMKRKDGNLIDVEVSTTFYEGKKLILAFIKNITEKKIIEDALVKSEEKYRTIVSEMMQGLALHEVIQDSEGKVTDYRFLEVNAGYEGITGLKRSEIIGKTVREVLPNTEEYWIETYGNVALTGVPIHYENYSKELDKYFSVYAFSPRKNHFAVMVTDVTRRTKEVKIIQRQNEELKEVSAAKDKLFSIIAHDLRGPFAGFMGLLEGLVEDIDNFEKDDIIRSAKVMSQNAKKIFELLNNLLEWSRLQLGKIDFCPEEINLFLIVEEMEELFRPTLAGKCITFKNNAGPEISVFWDKNMLSTVLRNLISNAIKFTMKGGCIEVNIQSHRTVTEIYVTDTGIGIPESALPGLFSTNGTFTTPGTEDEKGTGLGLMLCNELITKNKGSLKVVSELGKGSSFIISLPASKWL